MELREGLRPVGWKQDDAEAMMYQAIVRAGRRRCGLARDEAGHVAVVAIAMGMAPRVWSVLWDQSGGAYSRFPLGLQLLVLSLYAAQLGAETWGTTRVRLFGAALSAVAAAGSAWLFFDADWRASQWPYWLSQFMAQTWVVWKLSVRLGRED